MKFNHLTVDLPTITARNKESGRVYETPDGEYRVYIGLKMGVGDANKLAEYIAKHANADINIDELAAAAVEKVVVEKVE